MILDYFKIYKTHWFWAFFISLWFLFTYVNNNFFYESIAQKSKVNIENLAKLINIYSSSCMKNNSNTAEICIKDIESLLDEIPTYYGSHVTIKDKNERVLLEQGQVQYKNRELLKLSNLSDKLTYIGSLDASIEIIKRSKPSIWKSTLRSMFFSVTDIQILGGKGYDLNKAWLRSRPSFFFFFALLLSLQWLKLLSFNNLSNTIIREKNEINSSNNELIVLQKPGEKQKQTIKNLQEKIKSRDNEIENKEGEIEGWLNELELTEKELELTEKEVGKLSRQIDIKNTKLEQLQNDEKRYSNNQLSKFVTPRLKSILFNNPSINKKSSDTSTTAGGHHSKDFVKEVIKILKKDKSALEYITDIRGVDYDSHNRKTIVAFRDDYKNCLLKIISSSDEGYSAQIMLSTKELHNAVSIAKYIANIKQFKDYNIKVVN
jgi:hypothetical protein